MKKRRYFIHKNGPFKSTKDDEGIEHECEFIVVMSGGGKLYCLGDNKKRFPYYASLNWAPKYLEKGDWIELDKNPFAKRKS
jgi:hypothetical protein